MIDDSRLNQGQRIQEDPEYSLPWEAGQRANMYEMLASCFLQEPDKEILNSVENVLNHLEGIFSSGSFSGKRIKLSLKTLKQAYYDRFFVPFSGKYVPPIESSIRGGDPADRKQPFGPLDAATSLNVGSCYEAVGFDPYALTIYEPLKGLQFMDHIGFEMAFMSYLCYAEESSWELNDSDKAGQWRKLQQQFLSEHLSQWCRRYAEGLTLRGSDIYSDIAQMSAQWIENDLLSLNVENRLGIQ